MAPKTSPFNPNPCPQESQTPPEASKQESDILTEFEKRYNDNKPHLEAVSQREEDFSRKFSRQRQEYEKKLALRERELKAETESRVRQVCEENALLASQILGIRESFELQLQEKDRLMENLRCQRDDLSALCRRQQERFERLRRTMKVSGRAFVVIFALFRRFQTIHVDGSRRSGDCE